MKNKMIEVFKTNVCDVGDARQIITVLSAHFPDSRINFDLQDCDKVLRLEGLHIEVEKVMALVGEYGFACTVLE